MIFRRWAPGEPLVTTGYGLSVPPATAPAVEPSVMLVPLAAFDRRGFRIGYGKGHYDRAIARITAAGPLLEIGVAFACQEIGRVPEEPHDRPMRIVVTETDTIRCDAEAAR
jgi:5-formyltetrahydrofolate cyclo-ligase